MKKHCYIPDALVSRTILTNSDGVVCAYTNDTETLQGGHPHSWCCVDVKLEETRDDPSGVMHEPAK
jgi:hypothetical protein